MAKNNSDCLFCKIVNGDIPADKLLETNSIIAFNDIKPQAPIHCLIIPKQHVATLNDIDSEHNLLLGEMQIAAIQLAKQFNCDNKGYRLVFNCNQEGGQEVYHIHLHLLAGRQMHWPPG